jgi:alcohol dehydrogenase class IV
MPAETFPRAFAYTAPTIVWYAPDALNRLSSYLKRLGVSRAMLVCDPGVAEAGLAAQTVEAGGGRIAHTWPHAAPDAPKPSVEEGAAFASRALADGIVALGGGSSIDTGKVVALLARHGGDPARWDGLNKVGDPGLPLIAIPTTAGTGSEVSNIAVVKDIENGRKLVLLDRAIYPAVALLDPRLTQGLPAKITAATGVDALTHVVEGMVSTFRNPICDAIGAECIRMIKRWLPVAVSAPGDLDARGQMLLAASMAGQLVSMTFSGVAHAVAHGLGVGWNVHHGTGNAIALPWSIRHNARVPEAAELYLRAAEAFGINGAGSDNGNGNSEDTANRLADAIERFTSDLGLPTRLSQIGVTAADLPRLAEIAFADPSHRPNPTPIPSAKALEEALGSLL